MLNTSNASTIVGTFRNISDAQAAVSDLVNAGVSRDNISLIANNKTGEYSSTGSSGATTDGTTVGENVAAGAGFGALGGLLLGIASLAIPGVGPIIAAGPLAAALGGTAVGAAGGGLIGMFKKAGVPDEDAEFYNEQVRNGGAVVSVEAEGGNYQHIQDILDGHNAVNMGGSNPDVRSNLAATPRPAQGAAKKTEDLAGGERTMPVVEEQLNVGKRQVQGGGVRVYSKIQERPVEEQVNLHEEHVNVQRRPVNRQATESDFAANEGTIEVTEMSEEAVVSKSQRVVEEVVVGKQATDRTETVRDTVRRKDVEVENIGATKGSQNFDSDFRSDFQTRYGSTKGAKYESYAPAYQYGSTAAGDARYQGKSFNDVESNLRTDYERNNPGSAWESIKDSVRYGWDKVTGQR